MIPLSYIEQWRAEAPWQESYQIEQDLLISRMLIDQFSDDFLSDKLAFRGGTALHKLYFNPALRYSEDIDLVQLDAEPIGPVMKRINAVIDFFEQKRSTEIKGHGATAKYKYNSEESNLPLKIKVEINCQEHQSFLPIITLDHHIENDWFSGSAAIKTYQLNELLGSKLRALYQRNKGRDLFDLYMSRDVKGFDPQVIIQCFYHYMNLSGNKPPTSRQYELNIQDKMEDPAFINDMNGLIDPNLKYNIQEAYEWFMMSIIPLIDQLKPKP